MNNIGRNKFIPLLYLSFEQISIDFSEIDTEKMPHLKNKITLTFEINIINTYFNYIMTPKKKQLLNIKK